MERSFSNGNLVGGFEGDEFVGKYLCSLFESIASVDSSYIHYNGSNIDKDQEHVERVFAYELYHQWSNHSLISRNKNVVINSEIPKHLIGEARNRKINLMYPDMVLHHGQNEYEGNILICEIKREGYAHQHLEKMMDDFEKLKLYLSNESKIKDIDCRWTPFKLGVFILTVSKDSNLELSTSQIYNILDDTNKEILKGYPEEITKRIICVVYNGSILKYDTLYNMIQKFKITKV